MPQLSAETTLHIHDRLIRVTGGGSGLREPGLLEAIAAKPTASFGGQDLYPTVADKAAALFEALCNYHVFVDGNKRTAITCLEYYLSLHNLRVTASMKARETFVLRTATSHRDLADITTWIHQHSRPLE